MAGVPSLWGVLNLTPDSFSDGGVYVEPELAVARALEMSAQGAAVIDVGGESTKPGVARISVEEEQHRILSTVAALVERGLSVSVDTMNSATAKAAIALGVHTINDVSGGLADKDMLSVIADSDVDYVMMHWRGHSATMAEKAVYTNVLQEVIAELGERVEQAHAAGIQPERIILDPGIGFAKKPEHNWEILAGIDAIVGLGFRVLVGASRKRFLGELLPPNHEVTQRDGVSATLGVLLAARNVWGLRVHNVAVHQDALRVWQALESRGRP
jgi:dihydropteroate synthase